MQKRISFIFVFLIFVMSMGLVAQDVSLLWNTFLGSASNDYGFDIVLDSSGNIYMTGYSYATWGSPVNAYSGGQDVFVACMDSSGNLQWNTFLGCAITDDVFGIDLDSSGNVYVTGHSNATWGSPVNVHSGSADVFVACMDSSGNLQWNTFLGSASNDYGYGITLDSSGNIYVTGHSNATWGSPINPYSGNYDAFVACMDSSGNLVWNTFLGSTNYEYGWDIALDSSGNIYVSGRSTATWGSPINAHSGSADAFVACMDSSGNLQWNTFLGSANDDWGRCIALDSSGNIYVTGRSDATWGSPVNAHSGSGNYDAFVAKLNSSGVLQWNTFMGSASDDWAYAIAVDTSGNLNVSGQSSATWGSPVHAHNGAGDAFVASMDSSGNLQWNTFLGSASNDYGYGITLDSSGNIYVTGHSNATWGSPLNAYSGGSDVYVARLVQPYRITAWVSGGHGSVSPGSQTVINGEDAEIIITPDQGFRIDTIVDNGQSVTPANPYVITNVRDNHNVVVTFTQAGYPPTIELSAVRKTEQAWIIKKDYAEININITEHPTNPLAVARYILYRTDAASMVQLAEYTSAGSQVYIDTFLESGKSYSYQVVAVDAGGTVVAESEIVTI